MKSIKQLLQILLSECIKRDFKTLCSDGSMYYTGMCAITEDIFQEGIISKEECSSIKQFLATNKPEDAADAHWYDSTPEGNGKRIQFLEKQINALKNESTFNQATVG